MALTRRAFLAAPLRAFAADVERAGRRLRQVASAPPPVSDDNPAHSAAHDSAPGRAGRLGLRAARAHIKEGRV